MFFGDAFYECAKYFTESLFLLRKNPLRPPSLNTRNCEYSDRTTNSVFYGKQEAETACALMGMSTVYHCV